MNKLITLILIALTIVSCKKVGCTDLDSINYDKTAEKSIDNCSYMNVKRIDVIVPYNQYDTITNSPPELYVKIFKKKSPEEIYLSSYGYESFNQPLYYTSTVKCTNELWTIEVWDRDLEDNDDYIVSGDYNPLELGNEGKIVFDILLNNNQKVNIKMYYDTE